MQKISAIIPTFNEEDFIEDAIQSVLWCDEIIVIDSYSTDTTLEKVKRWEQIKILQREFDNFSSQKNHAIEQAKNDWIIICDADERFTPAIEKEIKELDLEQHDAFYIYRDNHFMNKKMKHSGLNTDKVIRLFQKNKGKYQKLVHEEIVVPGSIGTLQSRLIHYSYRGYSHYMNKLQQYAYLQALELVDKKKSIGAFHYWFKPKFRFFKHYIIQLGLLDGQAGYFYAKAQYFAVFMRYAYYKDLLKK